MNFFWQCALASQRLAVELNVVVNAVTGDLRLESMLDECVMQLVHGFNAPCNGNRAEQNEVGHSSLISCEKHSL